MRQPARRLAPIAALVAGIAALALCTAAMVRGLEPFATWYYLLAWYPLLLALDGALALTNRENPGEFYLLGRPVFLVTLLAWSAVLWLFYELLNFRLRNWYYVFVPDDPLARRIAIPLAFATVLPAVFTMERLFHRLGIGEGLRSRPLRVSDGRLGAIRAAGAFCIVLPLLWPRYFFPLVWGIGTLLVEPTNFRREPAQSLIGDVAAGRPGRMVRLLLSGALVGLIWELLNMRARGKWIYTVPGLEEMKLFEMPVPGFLGFPPFALDCFVIWQALVLGGVAVPRTGAARRAEPNRRLGAGLAAALFGALVLLGLERRTIDSYTPRLVDLPTLPTDDLARAGYDVYSLGAATPEDVGRALGARGADARAEATPQPAASSNSGGETRSAAVWIETARLVVLRGIGTANAERLRRLGITNVADLAGADPRALTAQLQTLTPDPIPEARVRIWVRGAQRALEEDERRPTGRRRGR